MRFARGALRMTSTRTIPGPITETHERLLSCLRAVGGPPGEQQAHWLAAAPWCVELSDGHRALDPPHVLRARRGVAQARGSRRRAGPAGPFRCLAV